MTERQRRVTKEMVFEAFINYDEKALVSINKWYGVAMEIFAVDQIQNPLEAEEIINSVLLNLWKSPRDGFKEFNDIKKYLFHGIRYACRKRKKRNQLASNRQSKYIASITDEDLQNHTEEAEMRAMMAESIYESFSLLPKQMEMVMKLHYIHKIRPKDIAVIMKIKPSAVHNLEMRAKKLLKKRFANTTLTAEKLMDIKKHTRK